MLRRDPSASGGPASVTGDALLGANPLWVCSALIRPSAGAAATGLREVCGCNLRTFNTTRSSGQRRWPGAGVPGVRLESSSLGAGLSAPFQVPVEAGWAKGAFAQSRW